MNLNLRELIPGVAQGLDTVGHLAFIQYVNQTAWISAVVLTGHLLFLAILGGSVLILNLRLLGSTLGTVSVRDVERATRPWRLAVIIGTILTGTALGLTTANSLLGSGAFLVKMVALVGAILFSVALAREARRDDADSAEVGATGRLLALAGLVWWLSSILILLSIRGLETAAFLVAIAGFSLFAVFIRNWRRAYVVGLFATLGGGLLLVEWIAADRGDTPVWLFWLPLAAALGLAIGALGLERRRGQGPRLAPARLAAFASTLAWVTVAAAGRWIAFI